MGSVVIGKAGDDILHSGTGDDNLNGGPGADRYVFYPDNGDDDILSFDPAEDTIDLTNTGIFSLDGRVTDDPDGNAVISLDGGNTITVKGVTAEELLANADDVFILASPPPPPVEEIFLDVNDTYVDAGDGTDQIIDGDSAGEGLTDTDLFVFGPGTGDDTITDFQHEDVDFSSGTPVVIPGDTLNLTAYGIVGQDYAGDPVTGAIAAFDNLVDITFLDVDGNVLTVDTLGVDQDAVTSILHFDDNGDSIADSTLTLLGVNYVELGVVLEFNVAINSDNATLGNA